MCFGVFCGAAPAPTSSQHDLRIRVTVSNMNVVMVGSRKSVSKLERTRKTGQHQVDAQRASILDAAERLFLSKGIAASRMIDIAAEAGITKITLYRYFSNRDVIALEIQARMMSRISAYVAPNHRAGALQDVRVLALAMIRNFDALRDAYRYVGMFDQIYLDNPPDAALTQWTKRELVLRLAEDRESSAGAPFGPHDDRFHVVLSTVVWFLEKLAMRGELTWSDQAVPLATHLTLFEDMIVGYIDRQLNTHP